MSTTKRKKRPERKLRSEKLQAMITPGLKERIEKFCEEREIIVSDFARMAAENFLKTENNN